MFPTHFPDHSQSIALGVGRLPHLNVHWFWGLVSVLFVVMILTTYYVTEIDLQAKQYNDYLYFFSFNLNEEKKKFDSLDCIIITKAKLTKNVNTRFQSTQFRRTEYTGTLIHDETETLDLVTTEDKQELLKKLKEFAAFLNVDVEDRTTGSPYLIDMTKIP